MSRLIIYSLETAICIALFYSAYWLFLKNETFFKINRFYLVFSVMVSLSLPLLNIATGSDSFISRNFCLPVEQYEESLFGAKATTDVHSTLPARKALSVPEGTGLDVKDLAGSEEPSAFLNSPDRSSDRSEINWKGLLLVVYFIGVGLYLIRFIANLIWIFSFTVKHRPENINGIKVIKTERDISPFSFLNMVVIGKKEYPQEEIVKILSHEKVHIDQKHSIDLMLFELLLVLQWFNPFMWFYRSAIKINHEYLADQGTLNSGISMPEYQYSLLNQVLSEHNFEVASSYSLSIKKRIAMMMQKRSSKFSKVKLIVVLPVVALLLFAFAFNTNQRELGEAAKPVTKRDTNRKEVSVPKEYLKLLEGEYVATNEPNRNRTIVFTELMGYLYGHDAGYTYKILPLGGESFVNPDDNASLVFDSKNKNAISLVLFGKIILKKQYTAKGVSHAQKRSLGFTLANVMLQHGVDAGLSFYNAAKDSANYYIDENNINYAGYILMQGKKLKESAAIFKLNTELFPDGWNTYDSYAEALLAQGDKAGAIENYKKSVKLNPGSKSGIRHLKELGVNDDFVKKVIISKEYFNTVAGDYLSTNEKNWVRWIRLEEKDGVMYGNDNGYRYSLIPMGDGKFINPDDGQSLVFDTKNPAAVTMVIFGKIHMKKVRTVNEADVNLEQYKGIYYPVEEDAILKPTEVFVKDGKLFRTIIPDPEGPNKTLELKLVTQNTFFYLDGSGRSLEFVQNDKGAITHLLLKRPDGVYKLLKQ